ncbi:MAG: nucleoside deaminase [Mariprofundus sp.]|nr:nucleoside deaminase [Mariprofundus sp.]
MELTLCLNYPDWLPEWLLSHSGCYPDPNTRMRLAIELSQLNIQHESGGPFGAAIFDLNSHTLIAAGTNRVVSCGASFAHAEIMAITAAQKKLGHFDLATNGLPRCELVSSCQPCAMCFGAIPWSGIRHVACGARDSDARNIGFDEGPRHPDWIKALNNRNISVDLDICRDEAVAILQAYVKKNGPIYNTDL